MLHELLIHATCTCTCTHVCMRVRGFVCMRVCGFVGMRVCGFVCMRVRAHGCVCLRVHALVRSCMCMRSPMDLQVKASFFGALSTLQGYEQPLLDHRLWVGVHWKG